MYGGFLPTVVDVAVDVSGVVDAPLEHVWRILSYFGDTYEYKVTVGQSNLPVDAKVRAK